jgi:uncharacterized protein YfiM (DUF2279 family)
MKIIKLIKEWLVANIDKILHLAVSYMLASLFGVWIAVIAGIAKEVYDQVKYKGWSWGDLIADGIGIAIYYLGVIIK